MCSSDLARVHTKKGAQEEKMAAAEQKHSRKQKRRRTFGRRKLQNSKNRPGKIVDVRLSSKVRRQKKNGTNVDGLQLKLSQEAVFSSLTVEVAKVQDLTGQVVGNATEATLHPSELLAESARRPSPQSLALEQINSKTHPVKAETGPGNGVVNVNGNAKDIGTNKKNLIPAQTRSTTLIRKEKKAKTFEQSLAKFCLGDRATKSIATERIKKYLTEPTKKLTRISGVITPPLLNGVKLPTVSARSPSKNRKRDASRSKSEKSEIPYELKRLEMWSEKRNGSMVKVEDQTQALNSTPRRTEREHFPNKSRRQRRISMSPDIVTLAAPPAKAKVKAPSKLEGVRKSQSAPVTPAAECILISDMAPFSQTCPRNTTKASRSQQEREEVQKENGRRMADVEAVLRELVDKVVLTNEINSAIKNEEDSPADAGTDDSVMAGTHAFF